MATERVKRLKDLVQRLERLPESPDRDRVLSEVRSRAVDLDTGVTPRAMLPVREPAPPPHRPASAKRPSGVPRTPSPEVELVLPAWAAAPPEWFSADDRLSLEDAAQPQALEAREAVRLWTFGLRA